MSLRSFLIIVILGSLLFIPFLDWVHLFDWDEINFAESAREMLVTGNYSRVQINFQPFWEKPPLFIWLQAGSMWIFGVNEFAARLPNALAGILTLLILYYIGFRQIDRPFARLWVLCYIGSLLPFFYFKSGIIDPLFNLFIFLGIFQFSRLTNLKNTLESRRLGISALAGLFIGLAILTKGPVAMLDAILCLLMFWIINRFRPFLRFQYLFLFFLVSGLVSCIWFLPETIANGPWFIQTFIEYQIRLFTTGDAGHGQPFWYHWVVLLIGVFPASIFIFPAFKNELSDKYEARNMRLWFTILLLVHLILFSIVKTKIVHYSSLCYFPITYLAAYTLHKILNRGVKFNQAGLWIPMLFLGFILTLAFTAIPLVGMNINWIKPLLHDEYSLAAIQVSVPFYWYHFIPGCLFFLVLLVSSVLLFQSRTRYVGVHVLLLGMAGVYFTTMLLIPERIEKFSQAAAVNFIEIQSKKEDCYIEVIGYKSYAQYFYSNKQASADSIQPDVYTLLSKPLSKPLYVITKVNRLEDVKKNHPNLKVLGSKAGFVFLQKVEKN
ncbi:MAG: glycosyltransferase family 39 protein [Bacteroidota bacterium]|nr:glycosyltransferase family 39 protein [Bacteroidota bacterium]